ncbi:MAG TPA: HAD family phosphatase [Symbiobacteriaceae bacterium]|jgi:HAD superfamily hydrolase (TIGR01509 family)|nr:HAD family phosphatase [Symbiobacteriaceae bacterium]
MSIKAVLFDIGGVLFTHGEWDYRREVAHRLGLGETLPHEYNLHMEPLQRGEIDERDVWAAIAGRPVDPTEFDDAYEKYYRPQPAMFDLARELRVRGLRTAILSNTQPSHVACMRRMDLFEGFDPLIFSNEAGRRKPEPEAFQLVLDGLGLAADEVLFIDDVAPYVEAARQVGLQGVVHGGDVAATRQAVLALL